MVSYFLLIHPCLFIRSAGFLSLVFAGYVCFAFDGVILAVLAPAVVLAMGLKPSVKQEEETTPVTDGSAAPDGVPSPDSPAGKP